MAQSSDKVKQQLVDLGYPSDLVTKSLKQKEHDEAVKRGLSIMQQGFIKVDHFDNIYRLQPKFDGAPNLRQVCGFQIYGTGQPNKSSILSLCNIWFNQMKLSKCLWINMRSEPVIYVNDISLSPRDPLHPSENIDFGEMISINDLNLFNAELEKTVKQNIVASNGICKYHKDTYAPLPADRKDRILDFECPNGADDVYGLDSLYAKFRDADKLNIELQRITVCDERAPNNEDIVNMVNVISKHVDATTVIIFNCMMAKGRTTEGMIMACLIQQIMQKKDGKKKEKMMAEKIEHNKWPNDVPSECEEYQSFLKKVKKQKIEMKEDDNENESGLSVHDMKNGNFTLIKQLMKLMTDEYGLNAMQIKKECDDIIDRCQHLQNMRECVYLLLLRYKNEARVEQKEYWLKLSRQYLERYAVLLLFNAYLNDVVIVQKKELSQISYIQWISDKKLIGETLGTLKDGPLSNFKWD